MHLTLVQAIARPEHMDYSLQKAVELGVQCIIPVITERSPPLDKTRINKREQHWHHIMIHAAEQCGRNDLPQLDKVQSLNTALVQNPSGTCIVLSPKGNNHLTTLINPTRLMTLFIGPEGGLTDREIQHAKQAGYVDIQLGPRILRTETAAITIVAICQALWGDLS